MTIRSTNQVNMVSVSEAAAIDGCDTEQVDQQMIVDAVGEWDKETRDVR